MNYLFPVVMGFIINIMGFNITIMGFNITIVITNIQVMGFNINKLIQVVLAYFHSLLAIYPFIMFNHSQ